MNSLLTPAVLDQLKIKIRQSVQDTASFMFSFDLSSCVVQSRDDVRLPSKASAMLQSPDGVAVLHLTIPNFIAQKLAVAIGAGDDPEDGMLQDIACEITNIVAHAIQAYFAGFPSGDVVEVGMPQTGHIITSLGGGDIETLRLSAPDGSADPVLLDFVFSRSP